jgi:hypothetical protein
MATPNLVIMNSDNTQALTEWHLGTLKLLVESSVLEINVWNNKGGNTDVPDLVNTKITTTDINGGTDEEAVENKWTYVLINSTAKTDANGQKLYEQIGGNAMSNVAADGVTGTDLSNFIIKGTANDGTVANSKKNYSNIKLKVIPPASANGNSHQWKLKIYGEFA